MTFDSFMNEKALLLYITILEKIELSPFKRIRSLLSKGEDKGLLKSMIILFAVLSLIWIFFHEKYQISVDAMQIKHLCIIWLWILVTYHLYFITEYFHIFSAVGKFLYILSAIVTHIFLVVYFYKGVIPFAEIEQGNTFLFQICISYLWWLSFSYFHRFTIILQKRRQRDPLCSIIGLFAYYVYFMISRY